MKKGKKVVKKEKEKEKLDLMKYLYAKMDSKDPQQKKI